MSTVRKPYERFAHYKVGKGSVTLSASVDEGKVTIGLSFCHPRDRLNKQKGREIALGRRNCNGCDFSYSFKRNDQRLSEQLFEQFEVHATHGACPPWVRYGVRKDQKRRSRAAAISAIVEETAQTWADEIKVGAPSACG